MLLFDRPVGGNTIVAEESFYTENLETYILEQLAILESKYTNVSIEMVQDLHYSALYESTSILVEAVDNNNKGISNYIKSLITTIKNIFRKIYESMYRLIKGKAEYIKKYEDVVRQKIKNYEPFEMEVYNFCINEDIPNFGYFTELKKSLNADLQKIIDGKADLGELTKIYVDEEFLAKMRGLIIDNDPCSKDELKDVLFRFFRNGESEKHNETYKDAQDIEGQLNTLNYLDVLLKEFKKEEINIITNINNFEREFYADNKIKVNSEDKSVTSELLKFRHITFTHFKEIINTIMICESQKIQAAQDLSKQAANIVMKAVHSKKVGEKKDV